MTLIRKPTILRQHSTHDSVELWLKIDSDIEDFNGHFPIFPSLPGVTQVDWAVFYGQQYLNAPASFQGMEVIKFQEPILKEHEVKLSLTWQAEKQKLYFTYTSEHNEEVKTHSSGRILLG
ncbi:hypothetical protein [Vibrio rumoiensis]|uniref:3-hydroxyacyl-ACP dehydratase n=1 Tax=Vibrio rumoiensis 1S-45 TaxID=1188252 RepID=A0A1E5E203_9VIBR|nr:hypothetical protein [Vibrio rumoiensis]OEF25450.1 3-hydroxyacyl-ACP dehydratase [Vibrio rumoiensis 1S-45]